MLDDFNLHEDIKNSSHFRLKDNAVTWLNKGLPLLGLHHMGYIARKG